MIKDIIKKLEAKIDLDSKEMTGVFDEIMSGGADNEDIKRFLLRLKEKGEKPHEIAAAAGIMRAKATKVDVSTDKLIDTCGTGGAPFHDANISSIEAFVVAGCGLKVAKHGNRSFTGKCGSADIMEALGVNINASPETVTRCIEDCGAGFIFAKNFHPAMKNVMQARKELKTRTIFNILGPLANPAGVKMQILGVFSADITELIAEALGFLKSEKAYVVHGMEGIDEISVKGDSKVTELAGGKVSTFTVEPKDFGLEEGSLNDVKGGDAAHNKELALSVLEGRNRSSLRDMVLMNASAALKMAGVAPDFKSGLSIAAESVDSGRARGVLKQLVEISNR